MDPQNSSTFSAQENVFGLMESLIRVIPEKSAGAVSGDNREEEKLSNLVASVPAVQQTGKTDNRRILKMKQQLGKQNKFINELKQKIHLLKVMKPKSISDHEELAFLKSRLDKENDLLKNLLKTLIDEQKKDKTQTWEPIRLCSDPLDDMCRYPWALGTVPMMDQRFSYDSTLSSLSCNAQNNGDCVKLQGDGNESLQKELMNRDRVIEILQNRVDALTADVMKVKRDNEAILDKTPKQTKFCEADMFNRLRFYKENTDTLERNLHQMGAALNVIRSELGTNLTGELQDPVGCSTFIAPNGDSKTSEENRRSFTASKGGDDQYNILLKEFSKKSEECKKLTDRLAKSCSCQNDSSEKLETEILKNRCSELLDEQYEFKVLIKEQADQLEDYRQKYLTAQQMVEEQKMQMNKMDVKNRRIEEQINIEVQRIKNKFQDKLRQLTPFPHLLEAEEHKVKDLRKSNEKLLDELKKSAKEIKSLEGRLNNAHTSQNSELERAYNLFTVEMKQLSEVLQKEEEHKSKLNDKLGIAQKELEDVRTETAKIIARMNDRAQEERKTAQTKQHTLELELAQSRAVASVTIGNREQALREMQGQIGVLSASFDDAQMQIQSLRNQLTFVQNERYGSRA